MKHESKSVREKQRALKEVRKPKAREMRARGYPYQRIADALHVSIMTAYWYCHDVPRGDIYKEIEK
jgi:DNA invertase Pin-like site-specific DNA recombinase